MAGGAGARRGDGDARAMVKGGLGRHEDGCFIVLISKSVSKCREARKSTAAAVR